MLLILNSIFMIDMQGARREARQEAPSSESRRAERRGKGVSLLNVRVAALFWHRFRCACSYLCVIDVVISVVISFFIPVFICVVIYFVISVVIYAWILDVFIIIFICKYYEFIIIHNKHLIFALYFNNIKIINVKVMFLL